MDDLYSPATINKFEEMRDALVPSPPGYSTGPPEFYHPRNTSYLGMDYNEANAHHRRRTKQRVLYKTLKKLLETAIKEMKDIYPQQKEQSSYTDPLKSITRLAATIDRADADADADSADDPQVYCPAQADCPCRTLVDMTPGAYGHDIACECSH